MGYSRALACLRRYSRLLDLGWSWLLASCCYSRLLAPLRHYSRVLDLVRSLLLLASTRILASTGIGEDARCRSCVFPCYSHTLVLASTRFRPESVTRVYSHTRVSHLLAYSHLLVLVGDASCPTCVFLFLASTRRSSPVLAITRLYSHTCVYWHC